MRTDLRDQPERAVGTKAQDNTLSNSTRSFPNFTSTTASSPGESIWDMVIIGSGVGGACLGYELARRGRSVCFCDLGLDLQRDGDVVRGKALVESLLGARNSDEDRLLRLRHGKFPKPVILNQHEAWLLMGSGTGGGSSTFGNVMDRMLPCDFEPLSAHGNVTDAMLPERWPIEYSELEPFYRQAEELFRIRGTWDPLRNEPDPGTLMSPDSMTEKEHMLQSALQSSGLNPYRIHYSRENVPGCNGCSGIVCDKNCRNDAGKVCVSPAVEHHGAGLLTRCEVSHLRADGRTVQKAFYRNAAAEQVALRGRVFVLSAGALCSPAILLRSGLGNSSDLAGRNLMFHASDHVQIRTKARPDEPGMNHGLSLNDFYTYDNRKLGNIHIHQYEITKSAVAYYLGELVQNMRPTFLRRLARTLIPPAASMGAWWKSDTVMGASIVEDLPYPSNRVTIEAGEGRPLIHYEKPQELLDRARLLRSRFKARTKTHLSVKWMSNGTLNRSHMCGTLRFGNDSSTSVLDAKNRAHDLDNLYVVDSSFFPTSGGINPSLTIAANALRVAQELDARL